MLCGLPKCRQPAILGATILHALIQGRKGSRRGVASDMPAEILSRYSSACSLKAATVLYATTSCGRLRRARASSHA